MIDFETLFKEVEGLQKELKSFQRGLISYGEVYHVDILLNNDRG